MADSGVHVSYSALCEGARLAPSGKPYDEDYNTLRSLLAKAGGSGAGRISAAHYRRALGIGPGLQDLLDPASEVSVVQYLGSLPPMERDKALRELVEENDSFRDAVKRAMDDKRRRDREGRTGRGGDRPSKAQALARDLARLNDQITALMHRYPPSAVLDFTREETTACVEARGTVEVLAMWIGVRVGGDAAPAARARAATPDLVGV
ncbi:hypothetical protein ACFY3M_41550 [Streptomyces mirabilis]|uniref:hypothetical protein n=1 Tax=Streptomyces mirabilis TaxID=68239 RepID=UPI00369EF5B1